MLAQRGLLLRTARDDDVAQRDRCKWQAGYCLAHQSTARRKTDFQYTAHAFDLCPEQSRKAGCAYTDCGGWRRPDVFECGSGGHGGFC